MDPITFVGFSLISIFQVVSAALFLRESRVQRRLKAVAHHPGQMILDPLVVDRDQFAQGRCAILPDGGLSSLGQLFRQNQPNQIRGLRSTSLRRTTRRSAPSRWCPPGR